jgi:hypothetical protein
MQAITSPTGVRGGLEIPSRLDSGFGVIRRCDLVAFLFRVCWGRSRFIVVFQYCGGVRSLGKLSTWLRVYIVEYPRQRTFFCDLYSLLRDFFLAVSECRVVVG